MSEQIVTGDPPIGYRVVERFDPTCGDAWSKYIAWSKLEQLREVVSLDASLNRCIVDDLSLEDWGHVYAGPLFGTFDSLEYALTQARSQGGQQTPAQLLAVI